MFKTKFPLAWTFHRNTSRWLHNLLEPADEPNPEPAFKEYFGKTTLSLPEPVLPETSLREAVSARLSCRRFTGASLTLLQLATVLNTTYGIHSRSTLGDLEFLERPVPSGGGLYPLELYLLANTIEGVEAGVYHYAALHHTLEQIRSRPLTRSQVSRLFMGQPYVAEAAVVAIFTAVVGRSLWKYGDRGYRYILIEVGHAAQNLNLVSCALGLASLNLGGFFDADLATVLQLDLESEVPLYAVAVGVPASANRAELRQPPGQNNLATP